MELTDSMFEKEVLNSDMPVFVDFWASWCPACKMMQGVISQLSEEYGQKARFFHLNIDRNPRAAELHQIKGVPTYIVFNEGKPVGRLTAAQSTNNLKKLVDSVLSDEKI